MAGLGRKLQRLREATKLGLRLSPIGPDRPRDPAAAERQTSDLPAIEFIAMRPRSPPQCNRRAPACRVMARRVIRRSLDRRPVLLIVGCGDVGLRVLRLLASRWRVVALTSSSARVPALRSAGASPMVGNLDDLDSLRRLVGLADAVLHLAPPPGQGDTCPRTAHLLHTMRRALRPPARCVYGSTTGVYGNCDGAQFDETHPTAPVTDRARRRVDAEQCLRQSAAQAAANRRPGLIVSVLRIPGIYAADRKGGDPRERVLRGAPVLQASDDVFTNHIHADDLALACVAALQRGRACRVYHACDGSQSLMGDHFDAVADLSGLPRPPRLSRAEAAQQLSPMQMSFLSESRRLENHRLREELKLTLRFPDVTHALRAGR
jgi:nucleoside-diphosphate-sugar epimerase